uniref:Uncharacterized protein n=1 Tax=Anguilla anguilla TaxID=7936 RepID=A0A0E9SHG3_ANGAN
MPSNTHLHGKFIGIKAKDSVV